MAARRRRKGRRGPSAFNKIFSVLLILAAIVAALTVFLKVTEIDVQGESKYTADEISEASGVKIGDHMLTINQSEVASKIQSTLYYVGEVSVARKYPGTLVITIKDTTVAGYIEYGAEYWLLDSNCKLLEKVELSDVGGAAEILGINPIKPGEGTNLKTEDTDDIKVNYLAEILSNAAKEGLIEGIVTVDMENVTNPVLDYMGKYTVKMGAFSEVDYKMQMLTGVIEKLGEGSQGVIDLSDTSKISFYQN